MRTLVVDVAADSGGALTILNQYYNELLKDKNNDYIFCTSLVNEYEDTDNIKILRFPWVKKSWFYRLWFDYVYSHKLIKKYKIDKVLSLQNIILPCSKIYQTLYLHQSLPYSNYKFSIFENKKFWIYQNIIGKLIHKSVKKSDRVIVQTQWMKNAVIQLDGISEKKIEVIPPKIEIEVLEFFDKKNFNNMFFYPASNFIYKNHKVILDAILKLKNQNVNNFSIVFTLKFNELSEECKEIYNKVKENVILLGSITHEEVMNYYRESVLIFSSYIETFGLPILEARMTNTPIIACDMPYAREILDGYEKVDYFDVLSSDELSKLIKKYCYKER